jgi:hypothetical protein
LAIPIAPQPFGRFALPTVPDIGRQGDQIATLVTRCEVGPRAAVPVDE